LAKKLVLLNFWATRCPYCVREIPDLKNVYEKYKDKGLEIVAVNIGESSKEVSKFVEIKEIKYKVVLDQKTQVARMYGVRGIPTNFLIGLDGNVIFADYVMPDEKIIEENLPKIPTPKPKKSKTEERR
jgi:thiol-disulfide isomerase/thioredoxin